jgi:hypothetical protein
MNTQRLQTLVAVTAIIIFVIVLGIALLPEQSLPPPTPIAGTPSVIAIVPSTTPTLAIPTVPLHPQGECARTPAAAVSHYTQGALALRPFRINIQATFPWERGAIVLFTSRLREDPSSQNRQFLHYMMTVEEPCGWRVTDETDNYILPTVTPGEVSASHMYSFYHLVYGYVSCSRELTIGLPQSNGEYLKQVTQNGFFALVTSDVPSTSATEPLVVLEGDIPIGQLEGRNSVVQQRCR